MLTILSAICLWLAITTGGVLLFCPVATSNTLVLALLFFNNLNILIAICEILLGYHISNIQQDYKGFKEQYKGREIQAVWAYLFLSIPNPFDGRAWSKMWSTYSLYDPSYQNQESFGFFIDVGNGLTTIPPCLLWNYVLAFPKTTLVSPLLVGCIGIACYWQIWYGTLIYFFSFFFNQRYAGKSWKEVVGFVGCTNGIWLFFPLLGIFAAVEMLRDGSFKVFEEA